MDPKTFGLNIWLIIGAVIWLGLSVVLVIGAVTALRVLLWLRQRSQAERAATRARRAPDGSPCIFVGRGLCDRCGQEKNPVYVLRPGESRCRACFGQSPGGDDGGSAPRSEAARDAPYASSSCLLTAHHRAADVG